MSGVQPSVTTCIQDAEVFSGIELTTDYETIAKCTYNEMYISVSKSAKIFSLLSHKYKNYFCRLFNERNAWISLTDI